MTDIKPNNTPKKYRPAKKGDVGAIVCPGGLSHHFEWTGCDAWKDNKIVCTTCKGSGWVITLDTTQNER